MMSTRLIVNFNLLGWLASSAPELRMATTAFEQAQGAHPEYGQREHPDLNRYGSFGFVEDALRSPQPNSTRWLAKIRPRL